MTLTARKIALAAFQIAEADGIEHLTMKTLAQKLNRRPSSLYNHIDGRDDLIERMRAIVVESIDNSPFDSEPWNRALIAWGKSYLAAFAAHPSCIRLLATTPITDPSTLRMYEVVVGALTRAGWPDGDAVAVMRTVEAHVLGSALDIIAPDNLLSPDAVPSELPTLLRSLDPKYSDRWNAHAAFELGIEALVNGLRSRLPA
ncbi:TetR/AcrR family transcriptional regulator C-terminal domain-containing protein [Cryobacterium sp. BB307]|uniref:TetR/AcrR family transcriptional regulator C-terminal domain-containing protein n=1 Tax=Cryobacterium sp. BB307 TaxID=2716317 RepID=UPI0014474AA7|nr:TetR/AcrR family transcriptional regulator C-terminal domain-containing protein [Cryobacterium sp. BB307]